MGGFVAVAVHQLQCLEICHQPIATKAGGEEAEAVAFDSWDLVYASHNKKLNALVDLWIYGFTAVAERRARKRQPELMAGLRGLRIGHDGSFYRPLLGDKVLDLSLANLRGDSSSLLP